MSDLVRLSGDALDRLLAGAALRDSEPARHLRMLADALVEAGRDQLSLRDALERFSPDKSPEDAQGAFRAVRQRMNAALAQAEIDAKVLITQNKTLPLDRRFVWVEGPDPAPAAASRRTDAETRLPATPVDQHGVHPHRPTIVYFVSYATSNSALAEALLQGLRRELQVSKDFHFVEWKDDKSLRATEQFHSEIQAGIDQCQLGLQLVSHQFLTRPYIRDHETPRFASGTAWRPESRTRLGIPIALTNLDHEFHDLGGFGEQTPFRLRKRTDAGFPSRNAASDPGAAPRSSRRASGRSSRRSRPIGRREAQAGLDAWSANSITPCSVAHARAASRRRGGRGAGHAGETGAVPPTSGRFIRTRPPPGTRSWPSS